MLKPEAAPTPWCQPRNTPAGPPTMYCENCQNSTDFYLTLDCAVPVGARAGPPDWSLDLQCRACGSLAVTGDPVDVLRTYL